MKIRIATILAASLAIWSLSGYAALTDAVKAQLDAAKTKADCQTIVATLTNDQDIADALAYLASSGKLPLVDIAAIGNAIADTKTGESRAAFINTVTATVTSLTTKVENAVTVIIPAPQDTDNQDVVINNGNKISQPAK